MNKEKKKQRGEKQKSTAHPNGVMRPALTSALNLLGIPTIHFPSDDTTFLQLRSSDFQLRILSVYRGVCDTPIVPYYAQLDQLFPGSKFILTTRDREAWLASVQKLWRDTEEIQARVYTRFVNSAVYGAWEFSRMRFAYVYDTHIANVRRYFNGRPDDLLELDICAGEGWSKLAPFLGMSEPASAFPHDDFLQDSPAGRD